MDSKYFTQRKIGRNQKWQVKTIAGNNRLIVDGGHNISASLSIANWIKPNQEVNLIVGMMKDKEHVEFIKSLEI